MSFIQDYLIYNEGNECPKLYHYCTALFLLNAAAGNRIHINYGYTRIYPNLYIGLIGKQGNRKGTAKDIGRDLFQKAFPDYPIGASVQSCNDIIKRLSSDDAERAYTNEEGATVSWRPMAFFINELKNFLSINPAMMIDFLTDIYDRNGKVFDSSTIKHGLQNIENPCINILACETPEWIVERLKFNVISGGFSRRIIYVYEIEEGPRIAFPMPTSEGKAALERCLTHLKKVPEIVGTFQWEPEARAFFKDWYDNLVHPDDLVLAGYYRSKHTQLLKVCMGLAMGEENPRLLLTKELLEVGLALLDRIEVNMPRLSIAAGRNELAIPQQNLLELLERNKGFITEKDLLRKLDRDLSPMEKHQVMDNLTRSGQIIRASGKLRKGDIETQTAIFLADAFVKWKAQGF